MTDTPQTMPIEIRNRFNNEVVYRSTTAADLRAAVIEAVGRGANLSGAYLSGANLSDANLRGAYLRGANLSDANLRGAYLSGANLRGANLRGANLSDAYLSDANLRGAYLRGANLSGANLRGANLSDAKITATSSVQFSAHGECGRTLTAIKVGEVVRLFCGCFTGTPDDLRKYIDNGEERHRKSRAIAMDTVLMLLEVGEK